MSNPGNSIRDIHWLMDMLQNIDVGLVILDRNYAIQTWNNFMQNHSNLTPSAVIGKNLFQRFPDIPENWFKRKLDSVFLLNSRAFSTWEQREYLFRFKNYRPITGTAEFMYQNITLTPLQSADGSVSHVGIIIYDVTDMAVSKQKLLGANEQLQSLSRTDALTQLNNRGYWEERLNSELHRVQRTKEPSSLIMFDIDHFKNVNDTFGHQAGDEVIRETSRLLRETMRTTDIAGRYGGEEFAVILVDTPAKNALIFADRLRQRIEELTVNYDNLTIKFTISLGVAEYNSNIREHTQWIEHADNALYQAKESGRNKVVVFKAS